MAKPQFAGEQSEGGEFNRQPDEFRDWPALERYLEDLYALPGIAETVNLDHIKRHYYMTHTEINPTPIVPVGPALGFA